MKYPNVTFTMTTFRRLRLFRKTMDSFMEQCLDKDLIVRWIVSDDGSEEGDFKEMSSRYPFLEIHTTKKRRGQAANLNYLFSLPKTEWIFHCEDDWLFLEKGHFLKELFDIAFDDEKIRNVTLRHWTGHELQSKKTWCLKYNLHHYEPDKPLLFAQSNCCWYGLTWNPSILHLPTVLKLGKFDETYPLHSREWDKPPAKMYMELGYKVANICGKKYITHLGDNDVTAYKIYGGY